MRVAFNATALLSPLTGIGQYSYQLAQALQARGDVDLNFFYGTGWSRQLRSQAAPGILTIKSLITRFVPNPYAVGRFVQQIRFQSGIRAQQPDIYHEPNFLAFKCKPPSIITVHDLSWIRYPHTHPVKRVQAMNQFFEKSLSQVALILTDSAFVKRELIDVFQIAPERIVPVALGVESMFRPRSPAETQALLQVHGLQHGEYLIAVGTLEPRKNLQSALHAFMLLPPALRKRYPLLLVGMKGWHTSALEQQIAPLLRSGEVRQLGYLSREDLAILLAGAKTLIYPSIYEGFGLPPLEAMACGVPVIASNVSSLPEVVGDTGLAIDPGDVDGLANAITELLEDDALRAVLSAKALARSKQFTWDLCAEKTVAAYRQVLGAKA